MCARSKYPQRLIVRGSCNEAIVTHVVYRELVISLISTVFTLFCCRDNNDLYIHTKYVTYETLRRTSWNKIANEQVPVTNPAWIYEFLLHSETNEPLRRRA